MALDTCCSFAYAITRASKSAFSSLTANAGFELLDSTFRSSCFQSCCSTLLLALALDWRSTMFKIESNSEPCVHLTAARSNRDHVGVATSEEYCPSSLAVRSRLSACKTAVGCCARHRSPTRAAMNSLCNVLLCSAPPPQKLRARTSIACVACRACAHSRSGDASSGWSLTK